METTPTRSFARTVLPWVVAAAMLLVYLVTLNRFVTLQSVWPLARASGMDWHENFTSPLTYLVMLPIRWLPGGVQLLALNFTAALFAAASLGLLARSIAILPQDRTQLQRDRAIDENAFLNIRLAWVPVVLGVAMLAFQRSFWENAIVGTGEALDLLLFAYCVRCLLEYRIDEKNSWLYKLSVVYGIGITNNVAMIGFLPVLLVALVWTKGLRFFRFDFLARMFLLAVAGMSLYLLLPLIEDHTRATFWQALRTNLVWQKHLVFDLRRFVWLPAAYALVPALVIAIKWSGNFGDASPIGNVFARVAAILLHAGLLALLVYVAFDPPVSPRESAAHAVEEFGVNFVFLPCYFLAALAIGYFAGFLLLLFSGTENRLRRRAVTPPALNYAVTGITCIGALVAMVLLLHENLPFIQREQSRSLLVDAQTQAKSLPENAVVLSDDPTRLHALAAVLGRAATQKYILLESRALSEPRYHRFLRKHYGDRVPEMTLPKEYTTFGPSPILQFLLELQQKHELAYLQPSFGYFFEAFYLEPRDAVYTLKPYPDATSSAPPASPNLIARQQKFWQGMESGPLKELKTELASTTRLRASRPKQTSVYVANNYSRALDYWGVELQRANRFDEALAMFGEALALNPDNAAALINQDFNLAWRKEHKGLAAMSKEQQDRLSLYQGTDSLLMSCGPVEEPSFLREFASYFTTRGLYRQAEQMLRRGLAYNTNDTSLQLALANVYLSAEQPARAAALVSSMPPAGRENRGELAERARIRAWSRYMEDDVADARKILEQATRDFPELDAPFTALTKLHIAYADKLRDQNKGAEASAELTNALRVVERQLQLQPTNTAAHFNHGNCCIFVGDFDCAIKAFTQVLDLQKDNGAALLNRAIAYYRAGNVAAAKRDYEEVLHRFTTTNYRVYYALTEIASGEKDWSAAREYGEKYLRYAPDSLTGERKRIHELMEQAKHAKK